MIEFRLCERTEVTSTNDVVKRAIEAGEPEGLAVRADVQTAGYGRQGRTWESPAGGAYLSVLLRPEAEPRCLPTLSIATAVAVRRACASFLDADADRLVQIKWPNDVVVPPARRQAVRLRLADAGREPGAAEASADAAREPGAAEAPAARAAAGSPAIGVPAARAAAGYRKLAGISHELHAGAVCVGVGANVARPAGGVAAVGGKNAPAYLCGLPGGAGAIPAAVARAVLRELAAAYEAWLCGGAAALLPEYAAHAYLDGRRVRIATADGAAVCEGVVRGVGEDARLVVVDAAGRTHRVASGEAHLI